MAEISDEDFVEEFDAMGHAIAPDNVDVFNKLRELCIMYQLSDVADVCAKWVAFVQNKKMVLKVTTDNLELMEREMNRSKSKVQKVPLKQQSNTVYNIVTLQEPDDDAGDDLLGAYSTPNSKSHKKRQHTPDTLQNKRLANISRSPAVPFSPTSFSPSCNTPSQKYSGRKNSSEVIVSFGEVATAQWKSNRSTLCEIKQYDAKNSLIERFKYMFQKMADKAHVLNDMIEEMGEFLKSHHKIEGDFLHVSLPTQDQVPLCGRICCDSVGKLNAQSVVLEGSRETSAGKHIPVDLSDVPQYSLFPGQIVAMEGVNSSGNKLVSKKIYENIPLPHASCKGILQNGPVSVLVAAGPFTTADSVGYEPLKDLMTFIHNSAPDVCILMGPFIDGKNADIEKMLGNMSYEDFFKENILKMIDNLSKNTNTQMVLVPSQRDVHADPIYPQPPLQLPQPETWNKLPQHQGTKRVHCMSDPCTLDIDGVVFGVTSADILFHLGAEEIANNAGPSDRLSRLTKHILTQHSYYPLYPPSEEVNIDYEQHELYAKLPVTPHVLVVPSELRYFVKDIVGCCCINPGRLAKGQVGGTFAKIFIQPPQDNATTLAGKVAAEIVRI